jgi:hypothetical protein
MLAIVAAILFGIALLIDLLDVATNAVINNNTLLLAGLVCLALHMAGVGAAWRTRAGGWYGRRRSRV